MDNIISEIHNSLSKDEREHYSTISKLWYAIPSQAKSYLAMHNLPEYNEGMFQSEENLLHQHIDTILDNPFETYIDCGPGAAKKSSFIMTHAKEKNLPFSKYVALDISSVMIATALSKISDANVTSWFEARQGDFLTTFNQAINDAPDPSFVYLGATMGNFPIETLHKNIFSHLGTHDSIYLSIQPRKNIDELLSQYQSIFYSDSLQPLLRAASLKTGPMQVRFNEEKNAVENFYEIKEFPKHLNPFVRKDDKIILFTSWKPTKNDFKQTLDPYLQGNFYESDDFIAFTGTKK